MRAPPCVCEYKNDGAPQDRHRLRTSLQLCAPPTKRMRNQSRPGAATLDHHTGARERVPKAVVLASSTTTRKQEHPRKPSASVPGTCSNRDRCEMRARRALAAWRVRVLRRLEAPQRSVSLHHDERSATERARFVRELKNKKQPPNCRFHPSGARSPSTGRVNVKSWRRCARSRGDHPEQHRGRYRRMPLLP